MSRFVFPSIAHSDTLAYTFDNGSDSWGTHSPTSAYFWMFDTYGEGLTAHSASRPAPVDHVSDYLYSLAAAMLKDDELAAAAAYIVLGSPSDDVIAFAASVIWKESDNDYTKQRYYSMKLQKMGTRTKEHDKRFAEVHRYLDGSRSSILRLVTSEHASGFERMKNALAIDDWCGRQSKGILRGDSWPKFFGEDSEKEYRFSGSLHAARCVCESARKRKHALDALENYSLALLQPTPVGE